MRVVNISNRVQGVARQLVSLVSIGDQAVAIGIISPAIEVEIFKFDIEVARFAKGVKGDRPGRDCFGGIGHADDRRVEGI